MDDKVLAYFNSSCQSLRIFSVRDGRLLANYAVHAALNCMETHKNRLICGFADGTVCTFLLADPADPVGTQKTLSQLQNRDGGSQEFAGSLAISRLLAKHRAARTRAAMATKENTPETPEQ